MKIEEKIRKFEDLYHLKKYKEEKTVYFDMNQGNILEKWMLNQIQNKILIQLLQLLSTVVVKLEVYLASI